jgi:hypothetical protein
MKIDLDGIALDNTEEQATGDIQQGRCVSNINTSDKRNVASVDVPGGQGSSHNDLGRSAVVVTFDGSIFGENARTLIESIRSKFKAGDPVPFVSDLSGSADITKVIIDNFVVNDAAGSRDRYDYSIVLKEYREPPEEPRAPGSGDGSNISEEAGGETPADEEAKDWSEEVAGDSEGSINTITGKVLDTDGNPTKGVTVKISGDDGEHSVVTDDEGVYKLADVPPGTYTASIDDGENSGMAETITVGGSGGDASGADADTGDTGGDSEGEDTDTGTDEDTGSSDTGTDSDADSSADTDTGDEEDTTEDEEDDGDVETEEPEEPSDDTADDTGSDDSGEAAEDTDPDTNTDDDTDADTGSDTAGDDDTDTGDDTGSEEGDPDEDPDSDDEKKTSWGF